MTRIVGPAGSRRRRRFLFVPILLVACTAVFYVAGAQAVHDVGVFQLDGNASTAINPAPTALEDWDLICKANPVTVQRPNGCTFAPGYTVPAGTTKASPSSFVKDPSQSSVDDILKGGTKDDNDMNSWSWTSAKPSPPKNDATDGFAAEYTCKGSEPNSVSQCSGSTGDKLLYFGADRFSNNGSANIAFWFFQKKVVQQGNQPDGTCTISSGCPFVDGAGNPATHKVGNVSLGGTTPGDILVISAFGPKAQIFVYEWVGAGNATKDYLGTNSCFTAACSLQPLFIGSTTSDCPEVTNDNACALSNDTSTASPWVLPQKTGGDNQFAPTDFFEGGLNLTKLGVGGACFSSYLINTRASAAGDAELHDKILGQFARCAPSLSTQASTNGTVQPGTAVHDTATVTVTGATSPDDATGTITFFLCGPNASADPDCTTGGTNIGTGTLADSTSNTHDGISAADSPNVNTSGSPLANGFYCFRAVAALTNYDNPDPATNTTTECFRVLKLNTSIVTSPQSPSGTDNTGPFALADNTSVYDHAVVTGDSADGFPEGTVTFFICNPSQVTGSAGNEVCASGDGTQVGSPVTATHVANETFKTEATSAAVTANQLGVWCFRATYTSTSAVYNDSSGGGHEECFTVTTTSSGTSAQNWLPNDHVTVSTATGTLAGTLSITLRSGSCTGTVVYTEPLPNSGAFTATAAGASVDTTNGSNAATTFKVNTANAGDYYWRIVFTPNSSFATGFTKCETSTVSINDNP